jgi:hypothetical protein
MKPLSPFLITDIGIAMACGRQWVPTRIEVNKKRKGFDDHFGRIIAIADENLRIPLELLSQFDRTLFDRAGWSKTSTGQLELHRQLSAIQNCMEFATWGIHDEGYEQAVKEYFFQALTDRRTKIGGYLPKPKDFYEFNRESPLLQLRLDLLQLCRTKKGSEDWAPYNHLRDIVGFDLLNARNGAEKDSNGAKERSKAKQQGFSAGWALNSPLVRLTDEVLIRLMPNVKIKRGPDGALILPTTQETRNHGIETDHSRILPAQTDATPDAGSVNEIGTIGSQRRLRSSKSEPDHQYAA